MNWGRAKTILIVLFLAIDILLLSLLIYMDRNEKNISEKNIKETVSILKERGITISEEIIPRERKKNILLRMQKAFEYNDIEAKTFLGDEYIKKAEDEKYSEYVSGSNTLVIEKNNFIYKNNREKSIAGNETEALKAAKDEFKKLDFNPDNYLFEQIDEENGIFTFLAYYTYGGVKITGNEINIKADQNGITEMSGTLLTVGEEITLYGKLMDITAVLCDLSYDDTFHNKTIENIEFTYYINESDIREEVSADPAYIITTSDGEKHYITDITQN